MITMMALAAAWIAGGALFLSGMKENEALRGNTDEAFGVGACLANAGRFDPAALVSVALFILAWPVVWIFAHATK